VATPTDAKILGAYRVFHHKDALSESNVQHGNPPYEQRALEGRGFGLIANKTLHRGSKIFAHTPVIAIQDDIINVLEDKDHELLVKLAVDRLPTSTREMFRALHGHFGAGDHEKVTTNAFDLNDYSAVFPETSVGPLTSCSALIEC